MLVHIIYGRNKVLTALQAISRIKATGLPVFEIEASDPEAFSIIYAGKRYDDANALLTDVKPDRAIIRVVEP